MAEHSYNFPNEAGAAFRADCNNALAAIVSQNSKATEPTTKFAYMWWADTANDLLKQRNAANTGWISLLTLSTGAPIAGVDLTTTQASIAGLKTFTGASSNASAAAGGLAIRGGQIGFPATQVSSTDPNTLDDYEEGTWTPANTTGLTLQSTQNYTKIGRMVFLQFDVTWPTTADASAATITGAPFAALLTNFSVAIGYANTTGSVLGVIAGSTISFASNTGTVLTNANFSGKEIAGTVSYMV